MTRLRAIVLLVLVSLCAAVPCAAQEGAGSAEWVVRRFMAHDSFPDRARYYAGEMAEAYATTPTLGSSLRPEVRVNIRALEQGERTAVYAATLRDDSITQDWYLHLVRDGGVWKLAAVRTLALPPLFYMAMDSLGATKEVPDSLAAMLTGMRLVASSDSALKVYFAAHAREMDVLASLVARYPALTLVSDDGRASPSGIDTRAIAAGLRALHIGAAWRSQEDGAGCVFLTIGGMMDNEVGYIHAPPGCSVPRMSPGHFIYVEQVAPEWYLYKTT